MTPSITGTVITYNEADHIEACIASLRRVCDDVVVVDSVSTDTTVSLAEAAGAAVIQQEYLGEGPQRKLTQQLARHDWILALDADERIDDEMCTVIHNLALDDAATAFAFNRKNYVGQHWIKGPGFYPDFVTRLYNRTRSGYQPEPGHAHVVAPRVQRSEGHIVHYTYDNLSDWLAKINWMTSRDARGMYERGYPPSNSKPILSALGAGFRQFVLRGGLFKGVDGCTVGVTSIFRTYMKYLKLNELHEQSGEGTSLSSAATQRGAAAPGQDNPDTSR